MTGRSSVDVVVIGGGILGCSVAYYLRRAGVERVTLLERAPQLGRQSSWAGAGFVSLWATEFGQDFHVLGGDNEAGISHGPALGKLMAELVTQGRTSRDISPYRLDRFAAAPVAAAEEQLRVQVVRPGR